jgi:hypothetical protein
MATWSPHADLYAKRLSTEHAMPLDIGGDERQHSRHPPIYMQDGVWLDMQGQGYLATRIAGEYMHGRVANCTLGKPDRSGMMFQYQASGLLQSNHHANMLMEFLICGAGLPMSC